MAIKITLFRQLVLRLVKVFLFQFRLNDTLYVWFENWNMFCDRYEDNQFIYANIIVSHYIAQRFNGLPGNMNIARFCIFANAVNLLSNV